MRREWAIGAALLVLLIFFFDAVNRAQVGLILENAAKGKAPLANVAFVFPLIPHPTPIPSVPPLYPESVLAADDVVLKYEDLGAGYWQTGAFNMVTAERTSGDMDWQAHFRFKFNPPTDPLHPGHSAVAIAGGRSNVRFANLGSRDFFELVDLGKVKWIAVSTAETPAVWGIMAGESIGLRIETGVVAPVAIGPATVTAAPAASPLRIGRVTYAKLFLKKLSHDTVRFDFVYQTDGKPRFPRPNPLARSEL